MPIVTTGGLIDSPPVSTILPPGQWAIATGSADVITAAYSVPNTSLPDGLLLGFRASAANATATPTFSPDGLPAHPVTRGGGFPLLPGDINGALAEYLVRYNLANTRWELLNPDATTITPPWAVAGGTASALILTLPTATFSLVNGMTIGLRPGTTQTSTTATLAVNGGTAHTIVKRVSTALASGDMVAGGEYLLRYNLANSNWVLLNPVVN